MDSCAGIARGENWKLEFERAFGAARAEGDRMNLTEISGMFRVNISRSRLNKPSFERY